ncbi:hypothetical protein [Duganella hordei]|uniref:hypothetical protein n=1 Tax=Duganella hordei TaxID=2865934 RepID=UPI00159E2017
MSAAQQAGIGPKRSKREPVDVAERKPEDKRLDQLLHMRKQRLGRFERERNEARERWRGSRAALRKIKQRWQQALHQAKQQWMEARQQFLSMVITSGEFRRAKAAYERMKKEAAQLYLDCREQLQRSRRAGGEFFTACRRMLEASRQQEKLTVMRDEIRALARAGED